jgi:LuxR family transcriptional regulator
MAAQDEDVPVPQLAPAGHYIALRLGFTFPLHEDLSLPDLWVELYTRRGYMMDDPVTRWAYANVGAIRWSAIDLPDPRAILDKARVFGMAYGAVVSVADEAADGQRSFGYFARSDREFTDSEIDRLARRLRRMHDEAAPPANLTRAEIEALGLVRDGYLMKEIAGRLGVTEGAVKQRLKHAKTKLGARTSGQAVSKAIAFGLI